MIYVGIDVAKDKHDIFICDSNGEVLVNPFTIENNTSGFNLLAQTINKCSGINTEIKIGLEATGHYSYNILNFLVDNSYQTYVINPLHTNLYRKSLTLRKTKTDKVDARTIAYMLMSNVNLKPYNKSLYHNDELKSLSRYRFDLIRDRTKLKISVSRLVTILFPELESQVSSIHIASVYALLQEFSSAKDIANAHLTRITNLLHKASKGKFGKETALCFKKLAKESVGTYSYAKALELKQTIKRIDALNNDIADLEKEINVMLDEINSPILSIPGIGKNMGAMIISEIGDFNNFSSPDKILAYSGLSPSTYQSGKLNNSHSHLEKRGSKYLRYALFNAAIYVSQYEQHFGDYLAKKRAEGKHYFVAITHVVKKLVRLMFALVKSGQTFKIWFIFYSDFSIDYW